MKKARDWRQVSFRVPATTHEILMAVALLRGMDLSAVINQIVAEGLPAIARWRAEYEAAMVGLARPQPAGLREAA